MRINRFGSDTGKDIFSATETIRETFYGRGGDDEFTFYNGPQPFFDRDFSDRFIGGAGDDLMKGLQVGFNDYTTYSLLSFAGGRGYDTVAYDMYGKIAAPASVVVDLSKFQTLERSVEHHVFNVVADIADGVASDFTFTGTAGDETINLQMNLLRLQQVDTVTKLRVTMAAGNDNFRFTGEARLDTDLRVAMGAGNDFVHINDSSVENSKLSRSVILTGKGSDTVVLEGMHKEIVRLGGGNDSVYVRTGGFADAPDVIFTGAGRDRIYLEIDEYSTIARIRDFDPARDTLAFDVAEFRSTTVTFDKTVADASAEPILYMDNAAGKLWFGDNVLAEFTNGAQLTAANFVVDDFLF